MQKTLLLNKYLKYILLNLFLSKIRSKMFRIKKIQFQLNSYVMKVMKKFFINLNYIFNIYFI